MRFRPGRWAVALVLVLSGCGVDEVPEGASHAPGGERAGLGAPDLVSARDTLPPAPPSATSLSVLLTHGGGAADPGLDAAAAALAGRPDIRVVVAAAGGPSGAAATMSGFPVAPVDVTAPGMVAAAVRTTGVEPDLVVVGIGATAVVGGDEPDARSAAADGVPTLVVEVAGGDVVDHAAAAMQLLEVLDLHLDALLEEPAAVHRLTVPSCRTGSLRGRLDVRPSVIAAPLSATDCASVDRSVPGDEISAVGAGYASLTRLR